MIFRARRHWRSIRHLIAAASVAAGLFAALAYANDEKTAAERRAWDFEKDEPGRNAAGFTTAVGSWRVALDGGNRVLEQKARNDNPVFNVALIRETSYKDLDLSVRFKSIDGELDQGGGLVWRAQDAQNYYIARYNPLEDNFRLYKVVKGKRTQLQTADLPAEKNWQTLRVTMRGNKIVCFLDGKPHLEAEDDSFRDAGQIGLWTKADARTYFDDLTVLK